MDLQNLAELVKTKEFWVFGVTTSVVGNLLYRILAKGRGIAILGAREGLARRQGYLKARETFAAEMGIRENMDILSFLALNYLGNLMIGILAVCLTGGVLGFSIGYESPLSSLINLVVFLVALNWLITTMKGYYTVHYALARILRQVLPGSASSQPAELE